MKQIPPPGGLVLSPLLQGAACAGIRQGDGCSPALAEPCRVNRPAPPGLPIPTFTGGNVNGVSADRALPLTVLEDMEKVSGTGQQLHYSILIEK